jgi:hypothetical protein
MRTPTTAAPAAYILIVRRAIPSPLNPLNPLNLLNPGRKAAPVTFLWHLKFTYVII